MGWQEHATRPTAGIGYCEKETEVNLLKGKICELETALSISRSGNFPKQREDVLAGVMGSGEEIPG